MLNVNILPPYFRGEPVSARKDHIQAGFSRAHTSNLFRLARLNCKATVFLHKFLIFPRVSSIQKLHGLVENDLGFLHAPL